MCFSVICGVKCLKYLSRDNSDTFSEKFVKFWFGRVKLPFCPWVANYQNTPECFCLFLCCFSVWHVARLFTRGPTGLTGYSFLASRSPGKQIFSSCVLISRKTLSLSASFFVSLLHLLSARISPPLRFPLCFHRYSSLIPSKRHPLHRELVLPFAIAFLVFSGFSRCFGTRLPRVPSSIQRRIDPFLARIDRRSLILLRSFRFCSISVRVRNPSFFRFLISCFGFEDLMLKWF